jgi:cysteinyl-tRNA synthetase
MPLTTSSRYPTHLATPRPLTIAGQHIVPVGPLRMYVCGITPYDVTHLGHASTFVWADLIATLGGHPGSPAVVCRNVTDVDDVLTHAAQERGLPYDELGVTQEFLFERDMTALGVARPQHSPHARSFIAEVQQLATALLANGAAYEADGFVYFRGGGVPSATGLDRDAAMRLSQEYGDQEHFPGREDDFDVAVWRPSPEGDPAWPSPWGWGRPGWHAECAAMSLSTLGSSVDVLVGGADLTFPHHAYQAAMVEAATGVTPYARAVAHIGEVRLAGAKMAKSTGNLMLVSDLLDRYSGSVLRLGLLNRPWDVAWDCVDGNFDKTADLLQRVRDAAPGEHEELHHGVLDALLAELDVPKALEIALTEGGAAADTFLDLLKLHAA